MESDTRTNLKNTSSLAPPTTLKRDTISDLENQPPPPKKKRLLKIFLLFISLLLLCCPSAIRTFNHLYDCIGLGIYLEDLFLPEDLTNVIAPPNCSHTNRGTSLLLYILFGFSSSPGPIPLFKTCLTYPNGIGCQGCKENGLGNPTCKTCENLFLEFVENGTLDPKGTETIELVCS